MAQDGSLMVVEEKRETELTHLSHSRISRYLLCPEQYRLYYIEGLRPKVPSANLEFGSVIHEALSSLFNDGLDPIETFQGLWEKYKDEELRYSGRDSWETLQQKGRVLLSKFVEDELPRIGNVEASEKPFELDISNLDVPLVGVIDLLADFDGRSTVVDFKTASAAYPDHEVELSDQLTAYQVAEPTVESVAFCVFVKTKEPRIDWHVAKRTGGQIQEFLAKAKLVGSQVGTGQFYKRPGKWCGYCDFLATCQNSTI